MALPDLENRNNWQQEDSDDTGKAVRPGQEEPYDGRLSRTVLRAPRGEIPRGDSTPDHRLRRPLLHHLKLPANGRPTMKTTKFDPPEYSPLPELRDNELEILH